jgi:hypothetical protein
MAPTLPLPDGCHLLSTAGQAEDGPRPRAVLVEHVEQFLSQRRAAVHDWVTDRAPSRARA